MRLNGFRRGTRVENSIAPTMRFPRRGPDRSGASPFMNGPIGGEAMVTFAIAGTGLGIIGLLVVILLVILIVRAL